MGVALTHRSGKRNRVRHSVRVGTKRRDLPRGRSWPLRPADVTDALDAEGLPHPKEMNWHRPYRPDGTVLEVGWGPKAYPYFDHWDAGREHLRVWVHDVQSTERQHAERELRRVAIPELVQWIRFAIAAPEGWRLLRHQRTWLWIDGQVVRGIDE